MPSMVMVSARARGAIEAGQACSMRSGVRPLARRLLARVLRFWAKAVRRKTWKPAGLMLSSLKRGAKWRRRTVEWTSGGGVKAEGGRVKRFWTSA